MAKKTTREKVLELWPIIGNQSEVGRQLGIARSTVQHHLNTAGVDKPVSGGSKSGLVTIVEDLPSRGVRRYILTCAQNNTKVQKGVWDNLLALARHYKIKKGDIRVSRFAYNMSAYTAQPEKPGKEKRTQLVAREDNLWYDPLIRDYFSDERMQLAPGLVWCGEMNILPTASRPLSDLQSYTGRASGIFPHVKIALDSVASGKYEATKFNYTTGTVTQLNYIQRKAGNKAEFHHCFGALLVEVDTQGGWWCRQLNADSKNVIYDLDVKVQSGKVTTGNRVEAINWGDLHHAKMEPEAYEVCFDGSDCMLEQLQPKYQFMHDLVDFNARNHHDRKNCHRRYALYVSGEDSVEEEMRNVVSFLDEVERPWCKTIVVDSNHDNAFGRWLREEDYKLDPVNAVYFLENQTAVYKSIRDDDQNFHLIEYALQGLACSEAIIFLREDDSFIICDSPSGGIECGMHGHLGINGARGSPLSFSKMGRKTNTGHTHSACIVDGAYVAGHNGRDNQGYNRGPGSWSWSDIVTYRNGKRALITKWDGKYRA